MSPDDAAVEADEPLAPELLAPARRATVNGRALKRGVPSGVQVHARRVAEILFTAGADRVDPPVAAMSGWRGHLWEQSVLPARHRDRILCNLGNFGPLGRRRSLTTIHDAAVLDLPSAFPAPYRRIAQTQIRALRSTRAPVATVSEYSRQRLIAHGLDPARLWVVGNGVRPVEPPGDDPAPDRGPTRFVFVGRPSDRRKRIDLALGAFARFRRLEPGAELVVAFGGPFDEASRHALAGASEDEGIVLRRDLSDDALRELVASASALIYPSEYEGFGLPPLEAASLGVPSIVADLDVYDEHQVSAYVTASLDVDELAAAMGQVLELEREPELWHKEARRHTWERVAVRYCDALRSVAAR